jgi:hypothetical protein
MLQGQAMKLRLAALFALLGACQPSPPAPGAPNPTTATSALVATTPSQAVAIAAPTATMAAAPPVATETPNVPMVELPGCAKGIDGITCESPGGGKVFCSEEVIKIGGRELHACGEERKTGEPDELGRNGCRRSRSILFVGADSATKAAPGAPAKQLRTRAQLAEYIGLGSPSTALHYALLTSPHLHEQYEKANSSAKGKGPYEVTLFASPLCGCNHPVERVTLQVTAAGELKELSRVKIGERNKGLCVD